MKSNNQSNAQDFPKIPPGFNESQVLRNSEVDILDEICNNSTNRGCDGLKVVKTELDFEIEECLKVFEIECKSDIENSEKCDDCTTSSPKSNREYNTIHSDNFHKSKITSDEENNPDDIKVTKMFQESILNTPPNKKIKLDIEVNKCNNKFEDLISSGNEVENLNVENLQSSNFFDGDTLILQSEEESDIETELAKCYNLINEDKGATSIYEKIDLDEMNVTDCSNFKTDECVSDNVNINTSNFELNSDKLETNKLINESNLLNKIIDIEESEIKKCNELLFPWYSNLQNKLTKANQKNNILSVKSNVIHFDKTELILEQETSYKDNSCNENHLKIKNNEEINLKCNNSEIYSNIVTNKANFEFNYENNSEKNSNVIDKDKFILKDNFKNENSIKYPTKNIIIHENEVNFKDSFINSSKTFSDINFSIDEKVNLINREKNSNNTDTIYEVRVIEEISKNNNKGNGNTELIANKESNIDENFPKSKFTPEKNSEKNLNNSAINGDIVILKDNYKSNSEKKCDIEFAVNEESKLNRKSPNSKITFDKNRPERIFKLAIGSLSTSPNNNNNINLKSSCKDLKTSSQKSRSPHSIKEVDEKSLKLNEPQKGNPVKDYFEDEKDDLINPEWQAVKNLSTNEERYRQVRNCWKSKTVPDPNKNLTYFSYRKRLFKSGKIEVHPTKQHKRHASSDLNKRNAKRPCTFFLDKEIDSIRQTKDKEKQAIITEMQNSMQAGYYHSSRRCNYDRNKELYFHHDNRVSVIADEYNKIVDCCEQKFEDKIGSLNEHRNEVLKFYSFYKGLNDSEDDPTLLSESQFQELDEIENVYRQFNHYYK